MEKGKIIPGTAQFFQRKKTLNEIFKLKKTFFNHSNPNVNFVLIQNR